MEARRTELGRSALFASNSPKNKKNITSTQSRNTMELQVINSMTIAILASAVLAGFVGNHIGGIARTMTPPGSTSLKQVTPIISAGIGLAIGLISLAFDAPGASVILSTISGFFVGSGLLCLALTRR